jgi:hypothetical protein
VKGSLLDIFKMKLHKIVQKYTSSKSAIQAERWVRCLGRVMFSVLVVQDFSLSTGTLVFWEYNTQFMQTG